MEVFLECFKHFSYLGQTLEQGYNGTSPGAKVSICLVILCINECVFRKNCTLYKTYRPKLSEIC